ncbi:hypothetical protein [Lysobacter olei]
MNAMTAIAAISAPRFAAARARRFERRVEVQVPAIERRRDIAERRASLALEAHLREVRHHSYLFAPCPRFRIH